MLLPIQLLHKRLVLESNSFSDNDLNTHVLDLIPDLVLLK